MNWRLCALALLLVPAPWAQADEIRLKDGSTIKGTIVDYENGSFKVETAYGFALVRKDSIAEIIPSEPTPAKAVAPSPARPAGAPATPSPAAPSRPATPPTRPALQPSPPTSQPAVARSAAPVSATPAVTAAPAAAPAAAAAAPAPLPRGPLAIKESVQGNVYTNETYGFRMFRPPGWELMPEARKALPNAIAAIGTGDESTLVVIGRETLRDSLDSHASAAERTMRQIYENYRPVTSTRGTVAGLPAVEWRFRGVADGRDWSVSALTVARGSDVFTLLGMTSADSDLIQIRENVIAKMISSLQFAPAP